MASPTLLSVVIGAAMQLQSAAPSSSPPPSHASTADFEALLQRGVDLRVRGRHAEAVTVFAEAYAIRPEPRAAGQLGLAEQATGQWVDAERHVSEALASTNDAWVTRHRAALEGAYRVILQHVGTLQIVGGIDGATVSLDGVHVATLPLTAPLHVRTGTYTLEIEAAGYYRLSRQVVISGGQITSEPIELRRTPVHDEIASPSSAPSSAPVASAAPLASVAPSASPTERILRPRPAPSFVPAVAFGVGALAFAAVGIGVLIDREVAARRWHSLGCEVMPFPECFVIEDHDPIEWGVGIAAFVAAAGLAIPSVYFTLRAAVPSRFACGSGPGLVGASCSLRF